MKTSILSLLLCLTCLACVNTNIGSQDQNGADGSDSTQTAQPDTTANHPDTTANQPDTTINYGSHIYTPPTPPQPRKTLGVVLGGGGAKAAAEIGVLKMIDEEGITVDCIAASSMGAFVGCLYAAGFSAKEIEDIWYNEEWVRLIDRDATVTENERSFIGVIGGDEFEEHLRELLSTKNCTTFEQTKIPFECTATEVIGKHQLQKQVLSTGDLPRAVRASLTFPFPIAGYQPVEHNGMWLVDGGMFNNLPLDLVEQKNVEQIIAVDLETAHNSPHFTPEFKSLTKILPWLANWARSRPDTERHKLNKEKAMNRYIYINPRLNGYSILDFSRKKAEQLIVQGASAFKKEKIRIMRLLDL